MSARLAASVEETHTSLISCAPAFSIGSSSSMARAMDTPSLMTSGDPYDCSRTTFLPAEGSFHSSHLCTTTQEGVVQLEPGAQSCDHQMWLVL